jgi:SAM-dependent methyltransferase
MKSNDRFQWMLEVLDINPSDKVLEVGCGTGVAAEMIAPFLDAGHLLAIDRSQIMIDKAMKRNTAHVKKGKISFQTIELTSLPKGDHEYSKIFAFNVNLFWTQKTILEDSKILRSHLEKKGLLYLFYQPPADSLLKKISEPVVRNLEAEQWRVEKVLYDKQKKCACFIAMS